MLVSLTISGALILSLSSRAILVASECTHLPSGSCFVDCTGDPMEIVCENVDGNQIQWDLETFAGLNATFILHLWNSPAIERLGGTSFLDVQYLLVGLELQNLVNLQMFPEVKALAVLKSLTILNAPKLTYFPMELLPKSIEKIYVRRTGITDFLNDQSDPVELRSVKYYRIQEQTVRFLDRYFMVFPNIEFVEVSNCHIEIDDMTADLRPFVTKHPIKKLVARNNTFSVSKPKMYKELFHQLVLSLVVDENSEIEISENSFPIAKKTIRAMDNLAPIKSLSLRGSYFETYNTLHNLFVEFSNLVYLDLGHTNLPSLQSGIFHGLPNLEVLKVDGNKLRGIEKIDFFQGLEAKNLSVLNLADNYLTDHPKGFEIWGRNILHYDLSGNRISKPIFTDRAQYFPKLVSISQARNLRTDWVSNNLVQMKSLIDTDLSCNNFRNITVDFFSGYPARTRSINLTQCVEAERSRPMVNADAFTRFPQTQSLYFDGAFLKSNFFLKLQNMSKESASALRVLRLRHNGIAFLHGKGIFFTPFVNLQVLDLSHNELQSTGSEAFKPLKNLVNLNLANNALFSIGPRDFNGLTSLIYLDLSGNKMYLIAEGAFDMLPQLRGLFLHDNNLDEDSMPLKVFGKDRGRNLTHISTGNLPLRCLKPQLFTRFPSLRWIYLNDSTPLFVHMMRRSVGDQLRQTPIHPWAGLKFCEDQRSLGEMQLRPSHHSPFANDFVKVQVNDPEQQVYQNLFLVQNTCFMSNVRDIKRKVENTLCRKN